MIKLNVKKNFYKYRMERARPLEAAKKKKKKLKVKEMNYIFSR